MACFTEWETTRKIRFLSTTSRSPTSRARCFPTRFPWTRSSPWRSSPVRPRQNMGRRPSVVINVTTRSGQGMTSPHGAVTTSYGSFGTSNVGFNLGYGAAKWGNFISVNELNSGRFLDPPEFSVFHAKGNEENLFDRVDYQLSKTDSIHLNLGYTRSWFQNPNSF